LGDAVGSAVSFGQGKVDLATFDFGTAGSAAFGGTGKVDSFDSAVSSGQGIVEATSVDFAAAVFDVLGSSGNVDSFDLEAATSEAPGGKGKVDSFTFNFDVAFMLSGGVRTIDSSPFATAFS